MLNILVLDGKMRATQIRANHQLKRNQAYELEALTLHLPRKLLLADQAIAKIIWELNR